MSQKVVQYQAVLQLSQTAPQLYDLPYLHRQMIDTLGVRNAEKIVPMKDDLKPLDPISENMGFMTGKPTKAFIYQDHEAHMAVHTSLIQDPKIMQMLGQNPQGQALIAAVQAHIMEHMAFQYRREIEKQLGASLPPMPEDGEEGDDQRLAPEIEVQLSQLAAAAAARVLQKDQAEMQAQQIAQQMQDPLIQMQQMDLQIKQMQAQTKQMQVQMDSQLKMAELQRKQAKDVMDAAAKADELELEKAATSGQQQLEAARLGVDIEKSKAAQSAKEQIEGVRLGLEIGRAREEAAKNQSERTQTEE